MTELDIIVLAVVAGAFVAALLVLGEDGRRILGSTAFLVPAGLIVLATTAFVASAGIRCADEWGCGPDPLTGLLAAVVLLLPTPYILAGLLGPPRPWVAGLLLSLVHLGCGVLAATLGLITGPASDASDGFVQMGAQVFLWMAAVFTLLVVATGPVFTAAFAWLAHPPDRPSSPSGSHRPRRRRHLVDRG